MAITSYLSRVIFKESSWTPDTVNYSFAGKYKLLVRAKTVPSPVSTPNTVESTTLEDDAQTFEMGVKSSDAKEVSGNLEKEYLDAIEDIAGKKIDIMYLYGTDGVGGVAKYAHVGQATATPSDIGGVDEIVGMTVSIIPNTAAKKVTDNYTVTYDESTGEFTVTAKS